MEIVCNSESDQFELLSDKSLEECLIQNGDNTNDVCHCHCHCNCDCNVDYCHHCHA